ncbi:major facilitator superfamily transporter [Colletotrichum scovillei]|nr:major facilitator superfamily transporter [Colletotrichum scovillei]
MPPFVHNPQTVHPGELGDEEISQGQDKWEPSRRHMAIMATAALLSLMVALDACVIVTSLQAIVADLELSTYDGFWIGTAYLLANAVLMLFIADLSRVFGRRPCLTISVAFFTLGTTLCCMSRSIALMLAGRSLQGVGGAGIIVLCLLIFTDIVPLPLRPTWYGLMYGQLYYVPLYFMEVKGFTPVQTGVALFPVMFTLVPASILTGRLVTVFDNYQWPIWAGWTLATIASGLMMLWDVETPTKVWAPTLVLLGLGHGCILNAQNMASQTLCDNKDDEAIAAAMYAFLRQFGMALGVGVGGSTFQNVMLLKLEADGMAPAGTHGGTHAVHAMLSTAGDAALRSKIVDAYVYGLRGVYGLYVGVSGLALLMSFLIKRVSLDRSLRSGHTKHIQAKGHGSVHGSGS